MGIEQSTGENTGNTAHWYLLKLAKQPLTPKFKTANGL